MNKRFPWRVRRQFIQVRRISYEHNIGVSCQLTNNHRQAGQYDSLLLVGMLVQLEEQRLREHLLLDKLFSNLVQKSMKGGLVQALTTD